MPQNEKPRPNPGQEMPEFMSVKVSIWLSQPNRSEFSDNELALFRAVALAYAHPTRPTIRKLYATLCEMLDEDERRSGLVSRRPSASMFRHLVLSLPSVVVDHMRYERGLTRFQILKGAERFIGRSANF
ncbi:hypothetical protein [Rhizobium ruizarguesonis]|jgi:hypothetical protein|uniref:hypothetical protein n=1 Tax=Rhizobium ruizarguesonis TaxID=2081791 RepID=UPI001031D0CC|nr:hypothetical protein [Rhizobium ruizarguesonis]TBC79520.1 hypothetical protein ELH30_16825 [Rhizobium ruizarguesonis]